LQLEEVKSDAFNWVFQIKVPELAMESHSTSSQVEVAVNR
jgi:hypothetical protein